MAFLVEKFKKLGLLVERNIFFWIKIFFVKMVAHLCP